MGYNSDMDFIHALNRGVDGRDIFQDRQDYARFVHDMYEFNDASPAVHLERRRQLSHSPSSDLRSRTLLVDIHGWCLMKNHYHLLLSEKVDGGITLFLRKLNVGYAKYFNERYKRIGTLFQGRTKKISIEHDAHLLYILQYIHLNPLDYLPGAKEWRIRSRGTFRNTKRALKYLKTYRWSSYLDYCGEKNFPSLLTTNFFNDPSEQYEGLIRDYLKGAEGSPQQPLILE